MIRAAVLTISTSRAAGDAEDRGGPALAAWAESIGADVTTREVIGDDQHQIAERLRVLCENGELDLILTTGGTGVAPSDRTPEATLSVIDREIPGIAEAMRLESKAHTEHWMLSRGAAGIREDVLIINFPGAPKAIVEAGAAIATGLPHALDLIAGRPPGH